MYNNFFSEIESSFSLEKLKKDLFNYLENDNQVISSNEINGNEKINILEEDDTFTISAIRIVKKYEGQNFIPYMVELVVGEYHKNFGNILPEKFVADMLYDIDYELVTIDFIHIKETD